MARPPSAPGPVHPSAARRLAQSRAALVVGAVLSLVLGGVGASAGPARADTTGAVSGTVTSPSGERLSGILVVAYGPGQPAGTWTPFGWGDTAADGTYLLEGLAPGNVRLGFFDQRTPTRVYATEYYADARALETATDVPVASGGLSVGRDAQLVSLGHITGTVRRTDGSVLDGIEVEAVVPRQGGGWTPMGTDVTDGDGSYDIGGLETDTYRVTFRDVTHSYLGSYVRESYNDKDTTDEAEDLLVTEGSVRSGIDAVLERTGILGGTVTNSSGDPIDDIHVQAYQDVEPGPEVVWSSVHRFTVTGQEGGYAIPLPTGTYRLLFGDRPGVEPTYLPEWYDDAATLEKAQDVLVTNEQTVTLPDVDLAPGGRISGSLTDTTGTPIGNVFAVPYLREDVDGQPTWTRQAGQLQTGEDWGAWSLTGLEPGTYRVGFENSTFSQGYVPEFFQDASTLAAAQDIVVGDGQVVAGKDVVLTATADISGTVTAPSLPGHRVRVEAYSSPDGGTTWVPATQYLGDGFTDSSSSGDYTVRGLPPGTYRIKFDEDHPGELATEFYDDAATIGQAQDVTVAAGERRTLGAAVLEDEEDPPPPPVETIDSVQAPVVSGAPVVGSRLTAARGTWTPSGLTFSYRWLRNGVAIAGATGSSYVVALGDRGRVVSVRVTASKAGLVSRSATSRATAVVRSRSATTVSAEAGRGRVTFRVAVTSSRIVPTGSVVIKLGTRTVATLTLSRGKAAVALLRQRKGTRVYSLRYSGDARVLGSSATKRVTIG